MVLASGTSLDLRLRVYLFFIPVPSPSFFLSLIFHASALLYFSPPGALVAPIPRPNYRQALPPSSPSSLCRIPVLPELCP